MTKVFPIWCLQNLTDATLSSGRFAVYCKKSWRKQGLKNTDSMICDIHMS